MLLYKIELSGVNLPKVKDRRDELKYQESMQPEIAVYFEECEKGCHITAVNADYQKSKVILCVAVRRNDQMPRLIDGFCEIMDYGKNSICSVKEITIQTYTDYLYQSQQNQFIDDKCEIVDKLGIEALCDNRYSRGGFSETMLSSGYSKKELKAKAESMLCDASFNPEFERIYAKTRAAVKITGHPVHYIIQTDDKEVRNQMLDLLLTALYQNGRIESRRYCEIEESHSRRLSTNDTRVLYKACSGGAVIVPFSHDDDDDGEHANTFTGSVIKFCNIAKKYRNQVLTVFCLPKSCDKIKSFLYENLGSVTVVELGEETVFGERAKVYLRNLAKEHGIKGNKLLYKQITDDKKGFTVSDLRLIFDEWYDNHIKTNVYTQYSELAAASKQVAAKPAKGSAYDELSKMIGLAEAKKVIHQALDFHKAQKLFRDKGLTAERPAMHMVFTGNPGTAKTTVARLFAQIMKENDLLSIGNLHEVGRADLVGKYVGWTAKIVKQKFKEAKGSVLFIDEAYSLVDDRDGLYGDEAINTIVQEMENNREDMIVIFAGYPDKMERFLQKNPGLRSRIAYHVPFADYDAIELYQITELLADKKKLVLDGNVREKLLPIYEATMKLDDFGNGRFSRNIIEKAVMKQASRLVAMDVDSVTKNDVGTLLPEDFEASAETKNEKRRIGF